MSLLVVFFEGTGNTLQPSTTQIGIFAAACKAKNIKCAKDITNDTTPGPWKIAFDGCGITHGTFGTLFAVGLDEQCNSVVTIVEEILKRDKNNGGPPAAVKVVAVGLSRGGIACMKLALKLSSKFKSNNKVTSANDDNISNDVSFSTLLFDPVPGNAVTTGFPFTASFSQDIRSCHNLNRVLAIYPYEPLPNIALHAPTLSIYPPHTTVEEDVTLGCHQGALFGTSSAPAGSMSIYTKASNLSFRRILDYLKSEGIELEFPRMIYVPTEQHCLEICHSELRRKVTTTSRITHDMTGMKRKIIRRSETEGCRWLNKHHQQLNETSNVVQKNKNSDKISSSFEDDSNDYQLTFDDGVIMCSSTFQSSVCSM